MKISITKKHIADGKPGNAKSCPIALALLDHKDVYDIVSVNPFTMAFWSRDLHYRWYTLPRRASDFVVAFDMGRDVTPFEFEVGVL